MRLTNDEKAILLGLLEDMSDEDDIEQQPMDIKETIVSVIGKLGGTYFGKLDTMKGEMAWNRFDRSEQSPRNSAMTRDTREN